MQNPENNPTAWLSQKYWQFVDGSLEHRTMEEMLDDKKQAYADGNAEDFFVHEKDGAYFLCTQKRGANYPTPRPDLPEYYSEDEATSAMYKEIERWGEYNDYELQYFDTKEEAIAYQMDSMENLSDAVYFMKMLGNDPVKFLAIFNEANKEGLGKYGRTIFDYLTFLEDLEDYADEESAQILFAHLGMAYQEASGLLVVVNEKVNKAHHTAYATEIGKANTIKKIETAIKHVSKVEHDTEEFAKDGKSHAKRPWRGKQWVAVDNFGIIRKAIPKGSHYDVREHTPWEEFKRQSIDTLSQHGAVYSINREGDGYYSIFDFKEKDRAELFPEKLAAIEEYNAQIEAINNL